MTALALPAPAPMTPERAQRLAEFAEAAERAEEYRANAKAPATLRAYRQDWTHFAAWCVERDRTPLPATPETIGAYLAFHAWKVAPATLRRRLSSICVVHQAAGHPNPWEQVKLTWQGIARERAGEGKRRAAAMETRALRQLVSTLDPTRLLDVRDRALLVVGFAAMLRRSELAALDLDDLTGTDQGVRIRIRRSKTDQEGKEAFVGVPYGSHEPTCPVRAWRAWRETLEARGVNEGAAFRRIDRHGNLLPARISGQAVGLVLRRRALAAGVDTTRLTAHSLRAGGATAATLGGANEASVKAQGRWTSDVYLNYVRLGGVFTDNAASYMGL
jgi:site-specific recombinase XerD